MASLLCLLWLASVRPARRVEFRVNRGTPPHPRPLSRQGRGEEVKSRPRRGQPQKTVGPLRVGSPVSHNGGMDQSPAENVSPSSAPAAAAEFIFATCQVGAERALKGELARNHPDFRFAYSRPGFVTFKLPVGFDQADSFELQSIFARAYGFSLGRLRGASNEALAEQVWKLADGRTFDRLHVWSRDVRAAGDRGYLPGPVAADAEVAQTIVAQLPAGTHPKLLAPTRPGDLVLDVVIIENATTQANGQQPTEAEWYLGYHRARGEFSCLPGGMTPVELPEHAVSRAYLKLQEGLRWSQLPLKPGERCAEIGAAPGGASQALLERGMQVMGIDPAEIDPRVLEHPNFVHIRKRGSEVRRREFRKTRWLLADLNVAPQYTLDAVEAIALHDEVQLRGLLLTLKFLDWNLADEITAYLERIRSWGFNWVQARQLQTSRQEICVAAQLEKPSTTRRSSHKTLRPGTPGRRWP